MTHPRDRFRPAPGRVTVIPQHPCRRRTDPDVLSSLRDAHNVPRNSRCPAGGFDSHGSGLNDHILPGTVTVAENLQSSAAGHAAAEAPDAISLVQHVAPPQGPSPAVDFSQGGGADPTKEAA